MTFDKSNAFVSGEPGTTGREPFEQSSAGGVGVSHIQHGQQGHVHDNNGSYQEGSYPEGSSGLSGVVGASHIQHGQQGHVHDNNCSYQEGSSGLAGVGAGATSGLGQGHQGHHHSGHTGGVAGDNYGSAGGVGTGRQFDQTGNTKADSETGASHHTGHHGQGTGHGLAAAAAGATGATGAGHHNHHQFGADVGVNRQEGSGLAGSGYDSNNQGDSSKYGNDRVGALGQNSGAYERTGADGPATTGAAGTDRFDTDRSKTGNAGSGAGFGPGGERHTEYGGNTASGYGGQNDVDKREKAAGTGGVGGLLTTTDKEFTGRDRLGGAAGAYGDETGPFKGNKDGPGNNTALTGREGNEATNPVANDSSKDVHTTRPSDSTTTGTTGTHDSGEKKGIVEKIKDALH